MQLVVANFIHYEKNFLQLTNPSLLHLAPARTTGLSISCLQCLIKQYSTTITNMLHASRQVTSLFPGSSGLVDEHVQVLSVVLSLSMSCTHFQGTGCLLSAANYYTEYGKEYVGGDLNTPAAACANQTTLCQCAELCAETDNCRMFTWTHPSSTSCPGGCRLKGAVRTTTLHGGTNNFQVTTGLLLKGGCSNMLHFQDSVRCTVA
jgi:hypothetical protein